MDHDYLTSLLRQHPGWRLLRAGNAAFVAAVLHRVFVAENARTVDETALLEAVDDELYRQRRFEPEALPRSPKEYVTEWASPEKGWLRSFYPTGSDLPSYDLTPAAEKALGYTEATGAVDELARQVDGLGETTELRAGITAAALDLD